MGWIQGQVRSGPVTVAWADAATATTPARNALEPFGPTQVRRHAALTGTNADRFALGRLMLAELVRELVPGAALTLDSTCNRCGEDHGRPRFTQAPVHVSVSYASNMVAVAAASSSEVSAVGIDIERAGDPPDLAPLFAPHAPPNLTEWTQLEAALKADGRGVNVAFAEVRFEGHDVWLPGRPAPIRTENINVPGYVLSSAILLA